MDRDVLGTFATLRDPSVPVQASAIHHRDGPRVPKSFVDETLWPVFQELDKILSEYIGSVTTNLINKHIHQNAAEAEVVEEVPHIQG